MLTPTSFLEELVTKLPIAHIHDPSVTVVLPNERAVTALKQHIMPLLAAKSAGPLVLSMDAFMQRLSPCKQASTLQVTHVLYQIFQESQSYKAPFEQFYTWGGTLLEDFDIIDRYLINAAHFFTALRDEKALNFSYDYLTEAQKEAIRSFWKHFEQRQSSYQQAFFQRWQSLPKIYQQLTKRLHELGIGYLGWCYRSAYETLLKGNIASTHRRLIFAGFNVITPVEEAIMQWYQTHLSAEFYWDVDAYYMEDTRQEAGLYLRAHQQKILFQKSFVRPFPQRISARIQQIYLTEVAAEVGQVQLVCDQLKALVKRLGEEFVPHKTAVVLANESLYMPMFQALSSLDHIPIGTNLGYPLKDTMTYRLLEYVLALHIAVRQTKCPAGHWPVAPVLAILHHPHVMGWNPTLAQATIDWLKVSKEFYVAQEALAQYTLYATIFKEPTPDNDLLGYLIAGFQGIEAHLRDAVSPIRSLEKEAFQQLIHQLNALKVVMHASAMHYEALRQLLRQLIQPVKLSLDRASFSGVQLLDVLSTQNLDFEYVFIVGMNEGHFPPPDRRASMIPYNLRKGYGLPTADQHPAAVYAYHFYRLLQRAQQVQITYSKLMTSGGQGEMSRYLWQLLYEVAPDLKTQAVTQPVQLPRTQPIVIAKQGMVWQQLHQFAVQSNGAKYALTPSALNTYIDCSLRFYFQYLARIKAPASSQRTTNAAVFGQLLHKVMETLYAPLVHREGKRSVQFADLEALRKRVATVVQKVCTPMPHPGPWQPVGMEDDEAVVQGILIKLATRIITLDQIYAPFVLVGVELGRQVPLYVDFTLSPTLRVRLQGVLDRVDWKAGVFRVLDYKTGLDDNKVSRITTLFESTNLTRNRAAFQVLFYAWLFQQQDLDNLEAINAWSSSCQVATPNTMRVMPGIFNTRQLFHPHFDFRFFLQQPESRTTLPVEDTQVYQSAWEQGLRQTLTSLFDPTVPFVQTADLTQCTSCPYKGICERH